MEAKMIGKPTKKLEISDEVRQELSRWLRRRQMPAAEQIRARIILLSTDGLSGKEISKHTGVTTQTVSKWRTRFERDGIDGLTDPPRSGRPRTISELIEAPPSLCFN